MPTAVENVKAAQSDAESAAGAESGAAETETAEPEEPESLGATMTQDQLDALFAGDVVAAFAKPDEDETEESPDEVDQDPESAGDAGEPEEEVLEETEPALAAAEDQPAEEESNPVGDPEEEVTPISAEETPITDALEDIESDSTDVETPPEEVVTKPEMDILEELSAEADDDKIEPLELTDDDLASLLDDGGGGTEPEVAAAPTADAPSVPDLSQDEINSLFGAPADSQDAPTGSAELSQADIDALLAGTADEGEAEVSEPEEVVAQLEITDEELMGLTLDAPSEVAAEAPDLDSLAAAADVDPPDVETPAEATATDDPAVDAVAAAGMAMEAGPATDDEAVIETLEVLEEPSQSRRLLGLPIRLLAAVVVAPLLLIAVVAVFALGVEATPPWMKWRWLRKSRRRLKRRLKPRRRSASLKTWARQPPSPCPKRWSLLPKSQWKLSHPRWRNRSRNLFPNRLQRASSLPCPSLSRWSRRPIRPRGSLAHRPSRPTSNSLNSPSAIPPGTDSTRGPANPV